MMDTKIQQPEEVPARVCYAVDLWNGGFYWEAHEALEHLWNYFGRGKSEEGLFLQCLIFMAAIRLKQKSHRSLPEQMLEKAQRQLSHLSASHYFGISVQSLIDMLDCVNRSESRFD